MMHCAHLTLHPFVGVGSHNCVVPPSPAPFVTIHFTADILIGVTTLGSVNSTTVKGPGSLSFIGKGNDSGMVVPHISIPPTNVLLPVTIAFGESKVQFVSSKVIMAMNQGNVPVAACLVPVVPIGLNQACNEPCNYPSDFVISPNSVVVGLTLGDILAGVVSIAIDSLINYFAGQIIGDRIAKFLMGKIAKPLANKIAAKLALEVAEKIERELAKLTGEAVTEEVVDRTTRDVYWNILEKWKWKYLAPADEAIGEFVENKVGEWTNKLPPTVLGDEFKELGEQYSEWAREAVDDSPPSSAGASPASNRHAMDGITGADRSNPNIHHAE